MSSGTISDGQGFWRNIMTFPQVVSMFLFSLKETSIGKSSRLALIGQKYSLYMYLFSSCAVANIEKNVSSFVHQSRSFCLIYDADPVRHINTCCFFLLPEMERKDETGAAGWLLCTFL